MSETNDDLKTSQSVESVANGADVHAIARATENVVVPVTLTRSK